MLSIFNFKLEKAYVKCVHQGHYYFLISTLLTLTNNK